MLTHLKFKNWRSLRDVEINDLTPITVFIGANSSGKTNIIEALRFRQYGASRDNRGFLGAIRQWGGVQKIRSLDPSDNTVNIRLTYKPLLNRLPITDNMTLFLEPDNKFRYHSIMVEGNNLLSSGFHSPINPQTGRVWPKPQEDKKVTEAYNNTLQQYTHDYITKRWQILAEGFSPRLALSFEEDIGDLYLLEPDARNLPTVISTMQNVYFDQYDQLQEDLAWLLTHVKAVDAVENDQETRLAIHERIRATQEAPSISAGTARIVAMLAAYYALDMDTDPFESPYGPFEFEGMTHAQMPGLVVIEEPDTALNPGILKNFVEQLRNYTEREDTSRQFILTTHNPSFLNYFQPEEVRVVSRGEDGYTRVDRVPEHIRDIWLDDHALGEVWMTNSFGGIAR